MEDYDEDAVQIDDPDRKLGKNTVTYAKWARKGREEVLPLGTREAALEAAPSREAGAFGVLCRGSHLDRVADPNMTQRDLIDDLSDIYITAGRPPQTPLPEWMCNHFFPRLARKLRRRTSAARVLITAEQRAAAARARAVAASLWPPAPRVKAPRYRALWACPRLASRVGRRGSTRAIPRVRPAPRLASAGPHFAVLVEGSDVSSHAGDALGDIVWQSAHAGVIQHGQQKRSGREA